MLRSALLFALLSVVICLLFICAGCPGLFRAVGKVAAECGPELIAEVSDTLTQDDWQAKLKERGAKVGIDAIACAVQAVLKSLTTSAPAETEPYEPAHLALRPSSPDAERWRRATQWLKGYRTERR